MSVSTTLISTSERIKQLGGSVRVPPTDIPNVGRFSFIADPQMAPLALLELVRSDQESDIEPDKSGRVGWHELLAADGRKALASLTASFSAGRRQRLTSVRSERTSGSPSGDKQSVALVTKPRKVPDPFWLYYFNIDDVDGAAKRVKVAGGQILEGPVEVPSGNWIIHCADPQGAIFALRGKRSYKAIVTIKLLREAGDPLSESFHITPAASGSVPLNRN